MYRKFIKELKENVIYLVKLYYDNPTISKQEAIDMFENKFKKLEFMITKGEHYGD